MREISQEQMRECWLRTEFGSTILLQHAFSFLIIDKAPIYPHATAESLCRPPFHSLINKDKTDALMNAHTHTHTHTGGMALTISHLHGNAIIWLWGVTLEWPTMCLTTSLSKHKEKLRRMEYILCLLSSSGFSIYTLKTPRGVRGSMSPGLILHDRLANPLSRPLR